jgi:hypothetical protein
MKQRLPIVSALAMLAAFGCLLRGQNSPAGASTGVPGTVASGVAAPWDISQTAASLSAQAERLRPILDQITPGQWKGAPDAYIGQWQSTKNEVGYLINVSKAFQKTPEKLTVALETYFRLQAVESQVNSLADGVRKYQNPAIGDLMMSTLSANYSNRDQLRMYIADLADTKEQELKVMDSEAQRCRGNMGTPVRSTPRPAATPKPAAASSPAPSPAGSPASSPAGSPVMSAPAAVKPQPNRTDQKK